MSDFITVAELRIEAERLCDENERLEAENARLREQVDAAHMSRLLTENENESLRELVRDMMRAWWACDNEVCPRHDERCEKGKYCAFDECARELGIEVDE